MLPSGIMCLLHKLLLIHYLDFSFTYGQNARMLFSIAIFLDSKHQEKHNFLKSLINFKGTRKGDSGGPILCKTGQGVYEKIFLSGIISFGQQSVDCDYPEVYTNVAYYIPWIKSHVPSLNVT